MTGFGYRRWLGFLLLLIAASIVAPLCDACAFLASEAEMPHEQWVRLTSAAKILFVVSITLSVAAAWFAQKRPVQRSLFAAFAIGFPACSQVGGLIAFLIIPLPTWMQLTTVFR